MSGFNINRAVQSGNLTRDPELRSLPSGRSVCNVGLAVNDRYKDSQGEWQDRPNYFTWTVWGGLGEWVAREMSTGDSVTLEGRATWRSWQDDQGNKRSAVEFTADSIVPGRKGKGGQTGRDQRMEDEANYGGGFQPHAEPSSDVPGASEGEFVHSGTAAPEDEVPF